MVLRTAPAFIGDPLEIIVFGGAILGIGAGLIIRHGGCLDGTEILAILINRRKWIYSRPGRPLHQRLYLRSLWLDFPRLAHCPSLAHDLHRRLQNDGPRHRRAR